MPPYRNLWQKTLVEEEKAVVPAVISGQLKKKIKKSNKQKAVQRNHGVVFIKNLPHGFFEEQLRSYFEQFGQVTRLRLVRSRLTGGSKGFAFVEFEYPEVAQVAAETMDNYLMFKKLVKATYLPPEKQPYNYFKSNVRKVINKAGKEIYVSKKTAAIEKKAKQHNDWNPENFTKRTEEAYEKIQNLTKRYSHLGIDFSKIIVEPKTKNTDTSIVEKAKTQPKLKDLLGDTLIDDSDDDEFHLSDDESDADSFYVEDEDTMIKNEVPEEQKIKETAIAIDGFEKFLKKHKQQKGKIQKTNKKPAKKGSINNKKKTLQVAAAKELAKPLPALKQKINAKNGKKSKN